MCCWAWCSLPIKYTYLSSSGRTFKLRETGALEDRKSRGRKRVINLLNLSSSRFLLSSLCRVLVSSLLTRLSRAASTRDQGLTGVWPPPTGKVVQLQEWIDVDRQRQRSSPASCAQVIRVPCSSHLHTPRPEGGLTHGRRKKNAQKKEKENGWQKVTE